MEENHHIKGQDFLDSVLYLPECYKLISVWTELPEKAGWLLHIDQGKIREHIGVEPAPGVD